VRPPVRNGATRRKTQCCSNSYFLMIVSAMLGGTSTYFSNSMVKVARP